MTQTRDGHARSESYGIRLALLREEAMWGSEQRGWEDSKKKNEEVTKEEKIKRIEEERSEDANGTNPADYIVLIIWSDDYVWSSGRRVVKEEWNKQIFWTENLQQPTQQ